MKGKKKIALPLLLAGVTATAGYVAPVTQAVATVSATTTTSDTDETKVVGEKLTVTNFQDTYSIGEIVYMPKVNVTNSVGVKYNVTKSGAKVKLSEVTSENLSEHSGHSVGEKYFKADYEGYYTIEISTVSENQVQTVLEKLSIYVSKTDASIVLPVNSQYVIPAKIQKDTTSLVIPAPSVLIGDDEEPTEYKDLTGDQELKVFIYTPSTKYDEGIELQPNADKTYFEVKTYEKNGETKNILSEAGTYTIVYKFMIDGAVVSTLDSNFQVVNTYDTSKIKLSMTLQDSMPTSGNVNTEVSVPKVKVTESSTSLDAINAHVTVKVARLKADGTGTTDDVIDFDYENYTFTPTELGDYVVSYKADINVFGLESQEVTLGPIKVSDKKGSTVMAAYDYVVDATDANKIVKVGTTNVDDDHKLEDLMVSAEHSLPSVLVLETHTDTSGETSKYVEISVPAIYGTDNYDKLSELTFTREYRDKHGNVTKIDPDYSKITTDAENTLNKAKTIKLTESGTYEFRYYSQDSAGNTKGYAEYTVVVYDDENKDELENGSAKVELNIPYTYVSDKDEYLTFATPTATDTYDKYIKVVTEYVLKKGDATIATKTLTDDDKNSDGKYSINIKELFENNDTKDATSIEVVAKAYLDGALIGTREDFRENNVVVIDGFIVLSSTKTVKLINSGADEYKNPAELIVADNDWNTALVKANENNDDLTGMVGHVSSSNYGINDYGFATKDGNVVKLENTDVKQSPFNQGAGTINLPTIQFKDKDDNLSITVVIKNAYGNTVTPVSNAIIERSEKDSEGKYTYTVSGASFELSNYGIYTVTYTAKNVGGSITTQTFGIRVNDKTKPTIVVDDEDKFDDTIEVGEKFIVPVAKLIKDGKGIDAQSITWEIVDATATYTKNGEIGFTPLEEGTFRIIYHAVDVNGNEAELNIDSYILSAKDTTAPILKLNDSFIGTWSWEDDISEKTITIPNATATDPHNGDVAVKISVSGPNSQTPTIVYEKDDEGNNLYSGSVSFVAKAQGTYTIKYTATDKAGNETTETKELKLGDCEAPELTWNDEENDVPTTATLNETFSVDLSNIKLTDNITSEEDLLDKLEVSLVDPNGSTVSYAGTKTHPSWNISSTGTYTLKFIVKDDAGNSETYSYKVEVPTEDVQEEKISPVVGTVLVVVAVVVLAGVVVYFVVSSKKKTPASSKKTKSAKK